MRAAISWIVILMSVGAVFWMNFDPKSKLRSEKAVDVPTAQQIIASRLPVGTVAFVEKFAAGSNANPGPQQARQAREAARTPRDRFYAGIVSAALGETEPAKEIFSGLRDDADEGLARDAAIMLLATNGGSKALTDEDRSRMIDRHRWIGKLATVYDLPATDPRRQEVVAPAMRAFGAATGFGVLILGGALLGLVLLVLGTVFYFTGSLKFAAPPQASGDVALLEAFAIYLLLMTAGMVWGNSDLPGGRIVGLGTMLGSVVLALLWPMVRGSAWADTRKALGLTTGRNVFLEVGCGVAGYVALLPVMVVAVIVTVTISRWADAQPSHPISEMLSGPLRQLVTVGILAVAWAPLTEELLFRGAAFGFLRTRIHWLAAAIMVGVIFASIHPQGWAGIPLLATIGVNLAIIRQWRGSIIAPVTAHALNNGTVMLLSVLMLR